MRLNDRTRKWLPWLLLAIAVIVTVAVYWPGLSGGWVFDDYPNIADNGAIHITPGHSTLIAWVNAALSSPASFLHRPLASITFAANWYFGGGNPWPYKFTNVVIHVINGVLVFCMLRALLRLMALRGCVPPMLRIDPLRSEGGDEDPPSQGEGMGGGGLGLEGRKPHPHPNPPLEGEGAKQWRAAPSEGSDPRDSEGSDPRDVDTPRLSVSSPPAPLLRGESGNALIDEAAATRLALLVSIAWMLLPINLMAVLYVVQRMESLCQLFVLAGLWAYLHGRWMMLTATDARRDRHGFALAVGGIVFGTLLGLTSKETAVLLPVFAFLAEWILVGFARHGTNPPVEGEGMGGGGLGVEGRIPHPHPNPPLEGEGAQELHSARMASESAARDRESKSRNQPPSASGHSGDARSVEPGIHATQDQELDSGSWLRHVRNDEQNHRPRLRRDGTRDAGSKSDPRILWTFAITLFVPAVLGFAWLLRAALRPSSWAGRTFTLGQRLLTEPRVLVDYLHWTLFPNPLVLSLYHDEIVKSTGLLTPWTSLGAIVLLAALIVIAVWLRNRRPLVSLGIGWFFGAQLLTATIVPLELVYEQRMYFASIGVMLAVGALLLGVRTRIRLPLLRGLVVAVALLWFGTVTYLRAQEWSNPIRLAVAEANRHPESARAVYEAGRQLLIASDYQPGPALDASWKYLREAEAIPGSSALPDQAMIMIADHHDQGDDTAYWNSMIQKLRDQPTRQEDISALVSLTNCYESGICKFDVSNLQRAYTAALSRPHPIARLDGAYADFQRDIKHDDKLATTYLERAVANSPGESAYRVDLAILYARHGQTEKALEQIDALRRMNLAGRLDRQIAVLEQLAEQGAPVQRP